MPLPSQVVLYQKNDQYLEIDGLADDAAAFQNSATVTATLYDLAGNAVAGATNISLTYLAASSGIYRGEILGADFNPSVGAYTLKIDASASGLNAHWEIKTKVQVRKQ